jgi:hypothetical protein
MGFEGGGEGDGKESMKSPYASALDHFALGSIHTSVRPLVFVTAVGWQASDVQCELSTHP